MKIDREEFLSNLEMVRAGLSPREFIEQSSCLIFMDGEVLTFNDEVACRKDVGFTAQGAVQANTLFEILGKLKRDKYLRFRLNENGELQFRGSCEEFGVPCDRDVVLPIERVEKAKQWKPLPQGFNEAIKLVGNCVSQDESRFTLTCIHIDPNYVEACDNLQIMRVAFKTGVSESVLVRGTSLAPMLALGMVQMAQTKSWIHFRNEKGLTFSCRQYAEEYPNLDDLLEFRGRPVNLPKKIADFTDCANTFAADRAGDPLVNVKLSSGKIRIMGRGYNGWYRGVSDVDYEGPKMQFLIAPNLLQSVCENYSSAQISEEKLRACGKDGKVRPWTYVTVLGPPEEGEEAKTVQRKTIQKKTKKADEEASEAHSEDDEDEGF